MDIIKLDKEKFRLGHTKVFFRAGVLGVMEETREDKIGSVLSWLQSGARGKASRMQFKKLQDQKLALYSCQRAIRSYMMAKTWLWLQIWLAIKPNLKCTQFGKFKKEYEDKIAVAEANIDKAVSECNAVIAVHDRLSAEKNELVLGLQSGGSAVQVYNSSVKFSVLKKHFRILLTKPHDWKMQGMTCKNKLMQPMYALRLKMKPSMEFSKLELKLWLMLQDLEERLKLLNLLLKNVRKTR